MGFGGATAAMITSLKNNNRRNKREAFDHMSGKSDQESEGIEVLPVSEEVLKEIRDKIRKQQRTRSIKIATILLIGIMIVFTGLFILTNY